MGTASEYTLRQILDAVRGPGLWDTAGISQIVYTSSVDNGVEILYTTPSGKTFYLTSIHIMSYNDSSWADDPSIYLRDDVAMGIMIEWTLYIRAGGQDHLELSFPTPVRVPYGWSVRIQSGCEDSEVKGSITGFEL